MIYLGYMSYWEDDYCLKEQFSGLYERFEETIQKYSPIELLEME